MLALEMAPLKVLQMGQEEVRKLVVERAQR
jgi:hypothetical protein